MGRGQQSQWNQSQINKSNAGLSAAQGYGAQASGENPAASYAALAANPVSASERAGQLSTVGSAYDAMGEKAAERRAKTGNSAGYGDMLDQLARGKSQAVGTANSQLDSEAFQRKMAALGGQAGVYGTDVGAQSHLLTPGQPNFQPGFWDQFLMQAMGNANKAASGAMAG